MLLTNASKKITMYSTKQERRSKPMSKHHKKLRKKLKKVISATFEVFALITIILELIKAIIDFLN